MDGENLSEPELEYIALWTVQPILAQVPLSKRGPDSSNPAHPEILYLLPTSLQVRVVLACTCTIWLAGSCPRGSYTATQDSSASPQHVALLHGTKLLLCKVMHPAWLNPPEITTPPTFSIKYHHRPLSPPKSLYIIHLANHHPKKLPWTGQVLCPALDNLCFDTVQNSHLKISLPDSPPLGLRPSQRQEKGTHPSL